MDNPHKKTKQIPEDKILDISDRLRGILSSSVYNPTFEFDNRYSRDLNGLFQEIAFDEIHTHLKISNIEFKPSKLDPWEYLCMAFEENKHFTSFEFTHNSFPMRPQDYDLQYDFERGFDFLLAFFLSLAKRNIKLDFLDLSHSLLGPIRPTNIQIFCDCLFILDIKDLNLSSNEMMFEFLIDFHSCENTKKIDLDQIYAEYRKHTRSTPRSILDEIQTLQKKKKEALMKAKDTKPAGIMAPVIWLKNKLFSQKKPTHRMGEKLLMIANHPTLESVDLSYNVDPAESHDWNPKDQEELEHKKMVTEVWLAFLEDLRLNKKILKLNLEGNHLDKLESNICTQADLVCDENRQYKHRVYFTAAYSLLNYEFQKKSPIKDTKITKLPATVVKHILSFLECPKVLKDQVIEEAQMSQRKSAEAPADLLSDERVEFEIEEAEPRKPKIKSVVCPQFLAL